MATEAGAKRALELTEAGTRRAREAAEDGARQVNEGVLAMREVSRAKRALADARERLEELEAEVTESRAVLDHRRDVEERYDDITAEQTAAQEEATKRLEGAKELEASITQKRARHAEELKRLKEDNERKMAPFRKKADGAKTSLADAERAHTEAKRMLKAAQAQADAAINNRDNRLASSTRAAEVAAGKLQRLQDQLAEKKRDPKAGLTGTSELSGSVAAALAQLETAREEMNRIKAETAQAVEAAQTHLYTQRKSLEEAERDLEEAEAAERERRERYEKLKADTDATEKRLSDGIREFTTQLSEARQAQVEANARIEASKKALEEAEDIHANPQQTESLAAKLTSASGELDSQVELVGRLAEEVEEVRERTQQARETLLKIAAAAVALAALIVWLVIVWA